MGPQSREVLTMDGSETVSFGRRNGCFVSNSLIALILLVFVCALIATGLLVFFFAGKPSQDSTFEYAVNQPSVTQDTGSPNTIPGQDKNRKMKSLSPKKIDVRLPTDLKPIHYLVSLMPFINGNFSINGYSEFTFEVMKPTRKIILHINDIITKNETVKVYPEASGPTGTKLMIKSQTYEKERHFYVATLMEELKVGMKYVISMEYTAYLNADLAGFYRSSYEDESGKKRWLAATQFQPTDARKAFPCLDEPALKAKFTIKLARESFYTSLSNMPLEKSEPISGQPGWMLDTFETSVPMSTYLVAFAISDFEYLESKDGIINSDFRVWARKSAISQAQTAVEVGPVMTKFFEEYFNIPFPLPKQDMIALPDFSAGAMENWGLITYRETAMLYAQKISTAQNKFRVLTVVSHELAHQWFGNLVTPSWWTDLWLNEGFASYMEYLGLDAAEPSFKAMEQFVTIDLQSVFRLDCLETSHPINIPVNHPDEINEIFDRISYSKGASIIRMMEHFLTKNTFRKGLTNYLNFYAYDSATQDDLWHHLSEQAHKDGTLSGDMNVKEIMDTWTLQMGFPVITVQKKGNMFSLKQERFLLIKNKNSTDKHDYKWWVPINYATESNPDFTTTTPKHWMKSTEAMKTIPGVSTNEWFIFNVQETGYYRVNYEQENWQALIAALKSNHQGIGEINRAQLLDDAMSLSRAGLLNYDTSLSLLSYLASENEYVPWSAALSNLGYIKSMFLHTGGYGSLKSFLTSLLEPIYKKVGFADSPKDHFLDQRKRSLVSAWMCGLDYKPCIDQSTKLFKQWMMNPENYTLISPNLKSFVYCVGVAEGGLEEWEFAWDRYKNANVGTEKRTLLYALGCSRKSWILSGYLKRGLTEEEGIRKQDYSTVIAAVAGNRLGSFIAWEFLKDKWEDILEYYGSVSFTLGRIVKSVTGRLNTKNNLNELMLFRDTYSEKSKSAKRAIEQAVEGTKNNLEWMNKNYEVIESWLSKNGYEGGI